MAEGLQGDAVKEVERISREAQTGTLAKKYETVVIHGETFVTTALTKIEKPDPSPGVLELTTLQGLVDYIHDDPDEAFTKDRRPFVLIQSPTTVSFGMGAAGPYNRRAFVAQADAEVPALSFGSQHDVEPFLTLLRTLFVKTPAVDQIVDWLSNIDATNAIRLSDDGMSQQITVNRGVRGKADAKIVNPILLQPYRTFAEVAQPESPFLLRLHAREPGYLPRVSITDADMGRWQLTAVSRIKEWLKAELGDETAVYG